VSEVFALELIHLRILWLIEQHPDGITASRLIEEMKRLGWCEAGITPADIDLGPDDVLLPPTP